MTTEEQIPCVSDIPRIQAAYVAMRNNGVTHLLAEMLAFKQPCGTKNTDRAFFENKMGGQELSEMPKGMAKRAAERYKRATGREIPQHAVYISQLAKGPGDPQAYFDSVGDIRKRCLETGASCEALGIAGAEVEAPKAKVKYNPRLLNRRLKAEMLKPENKGKKVHDMAEKIIHKHSYNAEE